MELILFYIFQKKFHHLENVFFFLGLVFVSWLVSQAGFFFLLGIGRSYLAPIFVYIVLISLMLLNGERREGMDFSVPPLCTMNFIIYNLSKKFVCVLNVLYSWSFFVPLCLDSLQSIVAYGIFIGPQVIIVGLFFICEDFFLER